jgi:hypothetical protein
MGRFLFVLVLLVAGIIALGFYRDWFTVSTSRNPAGKVDIKVGIDENKIESDADKAKQKAKEVFNHTQNEAEAK